MSNILVILAVIVTAVIAGAAIGERKGRPVAGLVLALLLGWVGVIVIALMPKTEARKVSEAAARMRIEGRARALASQPEAEPQDLDEFLGGRGES